MTASSARQLCIPPSFVVWIALIAIACFIYQAKWLWWLLSCQIMTLFKVVALQTAWLYTTIRIYLVASYANHIQSFDWLVLLFSWIINFNLTPLYMLKLNAWIIMQSSLCQCMNFISWCWFQNIAIVK